MGTTEIIMFNVNERNSRNDDNVLSIDNNAKNLLIDWYNIISKNGKANVMIISSC